jgi:hypothetical protein
MLSGIIKTEETRMLPIALIRRDGGTQPRDGVDPAHVADIRQAIRDRVDLPAIEVTYDGQYYWLWDGYHRTEAHEAEGWTEIEAIVHQGKLEDAQWASYGVNKAHGLKRTNADKQRQTRNAIKHPNAANKSNEQIAAHVGVDAKTVAKYRADMVATLEIPESTERTGKDGRTISTSNIGKRPALVNVSDVPAVTEPFYDDDAGEYVLPVATQRVKSRPLTAEETTVVIWRAIRVDAGSLSDARLLEWLGDRCSPADYQHLLASGAEFGELAFGEAWNTVRREVFNRHERAQRKAAPTAPPVAVALPATPPARYSPEFLDGMADVVRGMASELGEVCNFSIAINAGEFQVGATVAGERPRFATGKAVTLGEAWAKLKAKLGGDK